MDRREDQIILVGAVGAVVAEVARLSMTASRRLQLALSEKDLRLTLLRYFDKPVISDDLEADKLIDRCESGFERDVFLHLMKNGYRVIPQVKTGAYRIDMRRAASFTAPACATSLA
jgi:hypothetical protein